MAKREKFTNRMESISSVNQDLFTMDIKVNRSVWRNLPFSEQVRLSRHVSSFSEQAYESLSAEYAEMLASQVEVVTEQVE